MQNAVVSVVIPAYNEEKTIGNIVEETIQVMDSLGLPYEIIVVDDGSTDRTREIACRYKVTVLSNGKNQGKGYALRRGLPTRQRRHNCNNRRRRVPQAKGNSRFA